MLCFETIEILNKIAPESFALDWDNVGLLVGEKKCEIKKIIIGLDLTDEIINKAINLNADMIITHHPIFFRGIKKINSDEKENLRAMKLIKNNICFYAMHTNLDISDHGTNFCLCKKLELENISGLEDLNYGFMGRTGFLKNKLSLGDFIFFVKNKLGLEKVNFCGDKNKIINKIGLCSGSGANKKYFLLAKEKKCDVYLTGDIKYHDFLLAHDLELNLIDITHYASEKIFMDELKNELEKYLDDVEIICHDDEKNIIECM